MRASTPKSLRRSGEEERLTHHEHHVEVLPVQGKL